MRRSSLPFLMLAKPAWGTVLRVALKFSGQILGQTFVEENAHSGGLWNFPKHRSADCSKKATACAREIVGNCSRNSSAGRRLRDNRAGAHGNARAGKTWCVPLMISWSTTTMAFAFMTTINPNFRRMTTGNYSYANIFIPKFWLVLIEIAHELDARRLLEHFHLHAL